METEEIKKHRQEYEKEASKILKWKDEPIDYPVEVKCLYYMPTRRRVDLTNLLEATDDVLVKCGVLEDDNSKIIMYDRMRENRMYLLYVWGTFR